MILANCGRSACFLLGCLPVASGDVGEGGGKVGRMEERVNVVLVWLVLIFFFYLASQRISDQTHTLLPIKNTLHRAVKPLLNCSFPHLSPLPKRKVSSRHPYHNIPREGHFLLFTKC